MPVAEIGQAEWELLRYVADNSPVTVRGVADHAAETRGLARTTVLTMMERLRKKKLLTRRKVGGVFEYSSTRPPDQLIQSRVQAFVEHTLAGDLSPFVAYFSSATDLSDRELEQLKQLVRQLESRRGEATS